MALTIAIELPLPQSRFIIIKPFILNNLLAGLDERKTTGDHESEAGLL
jgi:hypothetical protein